MVRVTMFEKDGRLVGFSSTGHADYVKQGLDIVCSAISAITQTCILGLTDALLLKAGGELALIVHETEGISCILSGDTDEERRRGAELLFQTMELGLVSVQRSYRKTLKIEHREV